MQHKAGGLPKLPPVPVLPQARRMATFAEISSKGKIAMLLLALQFSLTPFIASWVHRTSKQQYNPTTGVFVAEVLKILIAVIFVSVSSGMIGFKNTYGQWKLGDSLKTALAPALLFGLQDLLIDYANRPQNKCEPIIFLLLNQTKILWGALFLWAVLRVQRSQLQWVALLMMFCGAISLSYDSTKKAVEGSATSTGFWNQPVWGIAAALGSAIISGFNQMLSEYITRIQPYRRPEMLFATELAAYKIVFMSAIYYFQGDHVGGFWVGMEVRPVVLLGVIAAGGICVALVNAQAGGDWKGYSLIAGLCFSSTIEFFLRSDEGISLVKVTSVLVIIFSVYIYNRFPAKVHTS
jgi:UDP-sugar transporter A1/2/3